MKEQIVDLGEYKIIITHGDNGFLNILVQDELGEDIEGIQIEDNTDEEGE